jgi:hypothetical protein
MLRVAAPKIVIYFYPFTITRSQLQWPFWQIFFLLGRLHYLFWRQIKNENIYVYEIACIIISLINYLAKLWLVMLGVVKVRKHNEFLCFWKKEHSVFRKFGFWKKHKNKNLLFLLLKKWNSFHSIFKVKAVLLFFCKNARYMVPFFYRQSSDGIKNYNMYKYLY